MNGENGISFKELFSKDIDRNINGVIKANDEKNLDDEVHEYVLTEEICRNLSKFLDAYNDPMNHEQNGAWISGFFGSGKSHLLRCCRIFWETFRLNWLIKVASLP